MIGHFDFGVSENCINIHSYGTICVRCGCCEYEPNEKKRLENQLEYYKDRLEEKQNFSRWDDDENWRKIQEQNVKSDIEYFKKKIEKVSERLKEHENVL